MTKYSCTSCFRQYSFSMSQHCWVPSSRYMSWSKSWSFALVALQRATIVSMQSVKCWATDGTFLQRSWAVSWRKCLIITLYVESSAPSTQGWCRRVSTGLRWELRGFISSVTQVCLWFLFLQHFKWDFYQKFLSNRGPRIATKLMQRLFSLKNNSKVDSEMR